MIEGIVAVVLPHRPNNLLGLKVRGHGEDHGVGWVSTEFIMGQNSHKVKVPEPVV